MTSTDPKPGETPWMSVDEMEARVNGDAAALRVIDALKRALSPNDAPQEGKDD